MGAEHFGSRPDARRSWVVDQHAWDEDPTLRPFVNGSAEIDRSPGPDGSVADRADPGLLLDRIHNLERALQARTVIGQAQGILMERHKLSATEAFDQLRTTSQSMNRKLRDVAADLTATGEEEQPLLRSS